MSATKFRYHKRTGSGTLTGPQSARYRVELWPAAARALGCSVKDDLKRKAVTKELTGKESTGDLTNLEITALFRGLEFIAAGGTDLAKAAAYAQARHDAADPEAGDHADVVGLIVATDFDEAYVAAVAEPHMRREGKDEWRKCGTKALRKVLFTLRGRRREQRRNDPKEDRPPAQRKLPYHKRTGTKIHETFMRALRAAVPSGALEEITPEREAELLDGIKAKAKGFEELVICECPTCGDRRRGVLGNAAVDQRESRPAVPESHVIENPF